MTHDGHAVGGLQQLLMPSSLEVIDEQDASFFSGWFGSETQYRSPIKLMKPVKTPSNPFHLEFIFGRDPDVTQGGSGHLRKGALDQVEPGTVLWRVHVIDGTDQ
jgi:hypothetical protein